eukprot:1510085-Karenia_brevis.AAC.1
MVQPLLSLRHLEGVKLPLQMRLNWAGLHLGLPKKLGWIAFGTAILICTAALGWAAQCAASLIRGVAGFGTPKAIGSKWLAAKRQNKIALAGWNWCWQAGQL